MMYFCITVNVNLFLFHPMTSICDRPETTTLDDGGKHQAAYLLSICVLYSPCQLVAIPVFPSMWETISLTPYVHHLSSGSVANHTRRLPWLSTWFPTWKKSSTQNRSRFTRSSRASSAVHVCGFTQRKLNNVLRSSASTRQKPVLRKERSCAVHKAPDNADTKRRWLAVLRMFHPPGKVFCLFVSFPPQKAERLQQRTWTSLL